MKLEPAVGTFNVRLRDPDTHPTVCESCGAPLAPVFLHYHGEHERPGFWEYADDIKWFALGEHTPERCRERRAQEAQP